MTNQSTIEVLASSQQHPPQSFPPQQERRLHPALVSLAQTLASRYGGDVLVEEFAGPYGRADFVLVDYDEGLLSARLDSLVPALTTDTEAKIITALSARYARPAEEIATRTGLWLPSVERSVRPLLRAGAITRTEDNRFRRHPALNPVARLLAIEAKLTDWGGALAQARKYSLWSRQTVVVLETLTNEDAVVAQARRLGVGIAVEKSLLVRPRVRRVPEHLALWASESLLETLRPLVS